MSDDDIPITEEWVRLIGFTPVPSPMGPGYRDHFRKGRLAIWEFNRTGIWLFEDADWIEMTTRKQLRALMDLTCLDALEKRLEERKL